MDLARKLCYIFARTTKQVVLFTIVCQYLNVPKTLLVIHGEKFCMISGEWRKDLRTDMLL